MSKIVGIDLGTTNSLVGVMDSGFPVLIADAEGRRATIYCTSYENASELSFYMKGHPNVWVLDADRPTAYSYFPGRPDPASLGKVFCVTRVAAAMEIPRELKDFSHIRTEQWQTAALGRVVRKRRFIVAKK